MSLFRATVALFVGHARSYLRSRTALYWSLAFPLFFLFMFGFVFGRGSAEGTTFLLPGLLTITLISGSFFGVSLRVVSEREQGILRRHRVTPVSPLAVVLAHGGIGFATVFLSLVIQIVAALVVFKIRIAGSVPAMALLVVLGAAALIPLGLIVGSVARDMRTAPAISNFLFFPLMFLSGATIPFVFLPEWMQRIARFLPSTYIVESLQGVIVRGQGLAQLWGPMIVLALTSGVGVVLNGLLFRWESTEPVKPSRLLLVLAGLGGLYLGASLLAPALEMARFRPQ